MSAVAWTHWDEAFLAAEKEPEKRLTFTLTPPLYERALVSLASELGWLPKSDPRYQEACRTGRLEWWDGRGRCVVVVREGSTAHAGAQRLESLNRAVEAEIDPPGVFRTHETSGTVVPVPLQVHAPPGPPGVDLGPPKVELPQEQAPGFDQGRWRKGKKK